MGNRLTDHRVLTFDCYGTLIDWEGGIWDALQPLIAASGRTDVVRSLALRSFATHETAQEAATPEMPYPELLARVHRAMAHELGLETTASLDRAFGESVPHWPAFPDTADALRYLAGRFRLVILSNVDRAGFAASNAKLGVTFDAVYTAEDVGSYKPAAANFEYLLDHLGSDLGLAKEDVLHTAQSLHHDHAPARRAGLANAWIDRQRLSGGGDWGATAPLETRPDADFVYLSLAEMVDAVRAEGSDR